MMEYRKNSQIKIILSFVFWILLFYCSYNETSATSHYSVRIQGGKPINITKTPYVLTIEIKKFNLFHFICGATIIHQKWAVTSGSCGITARRNMDVGVRLRSGISRRFLGATLSDRKKLLDTTHPIEKVTIHPQYNIMNYDYDVSIIKVSTPFHYTDTVQSILVASETPFSKTQAQVSGWGWKSPSANDTTRLLQQATVYIVNYKECKKRIPQLTPRMLCAEDSDGNMDISCPIDDGSPLVVDYKLVGITTMYWLLDRDHCHAVYTDVAQIKGWIMSSIAEELA